MNGIIDFANKFFKPILDMGGPIIMLIILTVLALLFGVKFSKALEGVVLNLPSPLLVLVPLSVCLIRLSQHLLQNLLRIQVSN